MHLAQDLAMLHQSGLDCSAMNIPKFIRDNLVRIYFGKIKFKKKMKKVFSVGTGK